MSTSPDGQNNDLSRAWNDAFKRILRPLVRVMLARGIYHPAVSEMLKSVFVEIADKEFTLDKKRQTDSRVSLLTGVHRKDVKRLRHGPPGANKDIEPEISLTAQIIAAWNANSAYVDDDGVPKPLARFAQDGGERSFEFLVKSISTDIHPRAVLDEWVRRGIAEIDAQNQVSLRTEAFIPAEGDSEKVFYFAHDLHDHVAATAHNVMGNVPPMLERCVHYDGLDAHAIATIREIATKQGMRALRTVNNRAAEALAATRDRAPVNPGRLTFGVYFYQQAQPASGAPVADEEKQEAHS